MDDAELRPLVGFWFPKITQKPFDLFCSQIPSCPAALGWLGGPQGVFKIYTLYIFTDYFFSILYSHFSSLWIFFLLLIFLENHETKQLFLQPLFTLCVVLHQHVRAYNTWIYVWYLKGITYYFATSVVYSKFLCISPPL